MSKSPTDRFKRYEASYKFLIPPRTYTIVRVDGRGFSKFTKKMNKPFDKQFSDSMNYAAIELCKKFNPDFAYTQSDEISLLFTDFNIDGEQIFGGKVQKLCSLTAARAAVSFNKKMLMMDAETSEREDFIDSIMSGETIYDTEFDSRVFVIPDYREVGNYFVHRQQDATRNSISMAADSVYSHKELEFKNNSDKQEMLMTKGINWNDYDIKYKRGVIITREKFMIDAPKSPLGKVMRSKWVVNENTPIFTQEREYLNSLIKTICPE